MKPATAVGTDRAHNRPTIRFPASGDDSVAPEVALIPYFGYSSGMQGICALLGLFVLASCIAGPRTEFVGPNGKMLYAVSCDTMNDCAAEARELCPAGHDIFPAASGAGDTTARAGIGGPPETRLLIECKSP
jgi:hypothetical protein